MDKSYILKFLKEKLIVTFILGIIIGIIIYAFGNEVITVNYMAGVLLGVMNFVLLTVGYELILSFEPLMARFAHFVFWALRYIAIATFIVVYYLRKDANIYAVIGGLLIMHISIVIGEMKKYLFYRKEG